MTIRRHARPTTRSTHLQTDQKPLWAKKTVLWHAWTTFSSQDLTNFNRIANELSRLGFRLVLGVPDDPPPDTLQCEHFIFPASPLELASADSSEDPGSIANLLCDIEALVECDRAWEPIETPPEIDDKRKRGLDGIAVLLAEIFLSLNPALVLVWNGHHAVERILCSLAQKANRPVLFTERGPIPGTLFVDSRGISSDSAFVRRSPATPESAELREWLPIWDQFSATQLSSNGTWWEQPADLGPERWRKKLNIPPDALVLLFAGQVDQDAQSFRFSPLFRSNLEAFEAFCSLVPQDQSVFILGKHHPKSQVSLESYQAILGNRGIWTNDLSLSDALALANRVAAVNSTVLFEAMLASKPVLSMGHWLGMGSEAAYEVIDLDIAENTVAAWISDSAGNVRRKSQRALGAKLLSSALFSWGQNTHNRIRGPREFAETIASQVGPTADGGERRATSDVLTPTCLSRRWRNTQLLAKQVELQNLRAIDALTQAQINRAVAEGKLKEVWIWGAGRGGQLLAGELQRRGSPASAFIVSEKPADAALAGLPVHTWMVARKPQNLFIMVVSKFVSEITVQLRTAGSVEGKDYEVLDPEAIVRLVQD